MDWLSIPVVLKVLNWARARLGLNREHDRVIFRKLDDIVNESRIDHILNVRIYTSDLQPDDAHLIENFIAALRQIENQYIDSTLQLRATELLWELDQLMSHVTKTFFSVGGNRLQFYPDPIDKDVYDSEWEELNEHLEKAGKAYETYRIAVKNRLMV